MNYVWLAGLVSACTLAAQPAPGTGSIEGHVLNSVTGAPVRKAAVELRVQQARIWLLAETDAAGRFEFTGLPPGSYRCSAKRAGFLERALHRPIDIGQDEHVTAAEIRMLPLSAITGRVLDEDGDPVGDAWVSVFKQVYQDGRKLWDQINGNILTNDAGEYRHSGLKPGRYMVRARSDRRPVNSRYGSSGLPDKPLMLYVPAYYPNAANEEAASPVDVEAGAEVRDVDIHLFQLPVFHVRGKVAGTSPRSQSPVSVYLSPAAGASIPGGGGGAQADPPDYAFDIGVIPGQYAIGATQGDGAAPEAHATDTVTVAGDVTGIVLHMEPPPEITDRIRLAESGSRANLNGVRVSLERLRISGFSTPPAESDAMAKLVFPKPTPPGHYAVHIDLRSVPNGCYVKSVKLGGQEISANGIEIRSSAEIEIVLSNKAGTINGSASGNDGKPILYPRVTLIPTDGNSRPAAQLADNEGKFKFTAVPPGKYRLFAWEEAEDGVWQDPEFRKRFESQGKEVTVGPSEAQDVQLSVIAAEEMN